MYSYLDINNHKYLQNEGFMNFFNGTYFLIAYFLLDLENKLI